MKFVIRHLSGSKAGQEEVFETKALTVGRNPTCNLVFDAVADDKVSGNHAQILVLDNGMIQLTDLGSSNGTYLGEQKISGPTPVSTGALVTFGEGGPQVSITLAAPTPVAEPPPPPPPPKKSKKPLIFGAIAAVLLLVGIVVFATSGGDEAPDEPTAEAPTEEPATEAPPAEAPPKEAEFKSPWADLGVGSSFTMKSNTDTQMGENKFSSTLTMTYTLKAKDENEATIELETIIKEGTPGTKSEYKAPLKGSAPTGEVPKYDEEKEVEIAVPAGKFTCMYRKQTTDTGTSETWIDESLPIPVKSITVTKTSASTSELIAVDKK